MAGRLSRVGVWLGIVHKEARRRMEENWIASRRPSRSRLAPIGARYTQTMRAGIAVGAVLGGSAGALLAAYLYSQASSSSGDEDGLARYPHVRKNAALRASLRDVTPLFTDLSAGMYASLLEALDQLCQLYDACRNGDARATIVARALDCKRRVSTALSVLTRKARQERPMAASDVSEDLAALKKFLDDQVYNITQEQSLQSGRVVD